ncbi:M15 family metallopeptidase [Isoptericola sp. NEAU-Y5]|uniref:M15 family metallopeptidase n=1 Tax=Isoptericola luteus TaxID=2879484 RepID=A0ABS7ZHC1_9MICO|nr:M15 family metallopeptidase [Isoptericola sp. NEAU-Y5]MCA5893847.1 M15 family metallopeptidase [Isoptericola sp. NEAU-Y5]
MREAELEKAGKKPPRRRPAQASSGRHSAPAGHTWVTRIAVLGSLAAATIAVPLATDAHSGDKSPFDLDTPPSGPSTLALLTSGSDTPATSAAIAAAPRDVRVVAAASRSAERSALPECDAGASIDGTNGALADHSLCDIWQDGEKLRADAAVALSALNEAFRARFGRNLCLVDSYRSISSQYAVKASRGFLAATPGTSMHGWGLAIDLCGKEYRSSDVYGWLWENGPAYGWENPPWAQRGGTGNYEPWHFEYRPGVEEVSHWH